MKASRLAMMMWLLGGALVVVPVRTQAQSYESVPGGTYRSLTPISRPVALDDDSGIPVGRFLLHVGLAVEGGYDSNVFYEDDTEGVEAAPLFHLMPTARLVTPSPRVLRLGTNLQLLWNFYPIGEDYVQGQSDIDLLGDVSAQFAPGGIVSATLYDVLRRRMNSPTSPGNENQGHFYNETGLSVGFHPGGSDRTSRLGFTARLTGGYGFELWDEAMELDRQMALVRLDVHYHFLPKTAVYLRGSWNLLRYESYARVANWDPDSLLPIVNEAFEGAPFVNVDSMPLLLYGGFAGLLTRALKVRLEGGYGFGFYDEGPTFEGFLARAELGVFFTPQSPLLAGWERGFSDSSFANYFGYDRFYLDLKLDLGPWLVGGDADLELQRFSTIEVPMLSLAGGDIPLYNTASREDPVFGARFFVAFNVLDWLRLSTYYQFRANLSDFTATTFSSHSGQVTARAEYNKHQIFLSTEFEY